LFVYTGGLTITHPAKRYRLLDSGKLIPMHIKAERSDTNVLTTYHENIPGKRMMDKCIAQSKFFESFDPWFAEDFGREICP